MTDAGILTDTLRSESRSFLQYVREAFPWAEGKNEATRSKVLEIATAEESAIQSLASRLLKQHVTLPAMGGFPASFTTSNFVAVDYLIPRLITAQKQGIAAIASSLAAAQDPDAKAQLQELHDLKSGHLQQLESLRSSP
jgi:hypothetical protein